MAQSVNNKSLNKGIIDMQDYVQLNGKEFPELINYIGFAQDDPEEEHK